MVKKICYSLFGVCLLFAISLSLLGVEQVQLGRPFMYFLRDLSADLLIYRIEIPDIPMIPRLADPDGLEQVLDVLIQFVNGFSTVLNIVVMGLNIIIQLLEFCFIVIRRLITFRNYLAYS